MAGLVPLFNVADIERTLDRFQGNIEDKILKILIQIGDHAVTVARDSGKYNDITGNLRSSIGYIVACNGQVLTESFQEADRGSDRHTGLKNAKKLAYQVAEIHDNGFVMILVAGMEYAVYVENLDGKDVLSGAVTDAESYARDLVKKLKNG